MPTTVTPITLKDMWSEGHEGAYKLDTSTKDEADWHYWIIRPRCVEIKSQPSERIRIDHRPSHLALRGLPVIFLGRSKATEQKNGLDAKETPQGDTKKVPILGELPDNSVEKTSFEDLEEGNYVYVLHAQSKSPAPLAWINLVKVPDPESPMDRLGIGIQHTALLETPETPVIAAGELMVVKETPEGQPQITKIYTNSRSPVLEQRIHNANDSAEINRSVTQAVFGVAAGILAGPFVGPAAATMMVSPVADVAHGKMSKDEDMKLPECDLGMRKTKDSGSFEINHPVHKRDINVALTEYDVAVLGILVQWIANHDNTCIIALGKNELIMWGKNELSLEDMCGILGSFPGVADDMKVVPSDLCKGTHWSPSRGDDDSQHAYDEFPSPECPRNTPTNNTTMTSTDRAGTPVFA
jgi:hypothetical protein